MNVLYLYIIHPDLIALYKVAEGEAAWHADKEGGLEGKLEREIQLDYSV